MIDVIKLQSAIINEPNYIIKVLEALEFTQIKDRGKYVQMPNRDGDNASAICIYKDDLKYINYTRGKKGNLFTLVQDERKCNFPSALEWVSHIIGVNIREQRSNITYPFGGFYKHIVRAKECPEFNQRVYGEADLPSPLSLSKRFFDDGVSLQVQESWGVRYDHESNSILIPWKSFDGKIVGCKARVSADVELDKRWWTYLEFAKTYNLYGINMNYSSIQSASRMYILEAEKSVLQMASWNCLLGTALGGHQISETQARLIQLLMIEEIVVAFDEGISEQEIIYESSKLIIDNRFIKTRVGYIFDEHNEYLPVGSKNSPTDNGKQVFDALCNKCIRWLS